MEPFTLHEEEARDWLTELVVAREVGIDLEDGAPVPPSDSPPIGMAWAPLDPGEEDGVFLLVRAAQEAGVITSLDEMVITFEFVDDGDEGVFRWLLDVVTPKPLKLATMSEAMAVLGEPQASGVQAAVAILRDAVNAANLLHQQLSDYVEATNVPGHGS